MRMNNMPFVSSILFSAPEIQFHAHFMAHVKIAFWPMLSCSYNAEKQMWLCHVYTRKAMAIDTDAQVPVQQAALQPRLPPQCTLHVLQVIEHHLESVC